MAMLKEGALGGGGLDAVETVADQGLECVRAGSKFSASPSTLSTSLEIETFINKDLA
jgi:hypothetical protein